MALRMCIHRFPVYDNGKTLVLSFSLLYPFLYDWLNEKNTFERSIASDNNGIFNVVKSTSCHRACVQGNHYQRWLVHSCTTACVTPVARSARKLRLLHRLLTERVKITRRRDVCIVMTYTITWYRICVYREYFSVNTGVMKNVDTLTHPHAKLAWLVAGFTPHRGKRRKMETPLSPRLARPPGGRCPTHRGPMSHKRSFGFDPQIFSRDVYSLVRCRAAHRYTNTGKLPVRYKKVRYTGTMFRTGTYRKGQNSSSCS